MKRFITLSLAAYACAAPAITTETIHGDAAPILSSAGAVEIPGAYIVKFKSHINGKKAEDHHLWVQSIHSDWVKSFPEGDEERNLELRKRGILPGADSLFRGLKHTYNIGDEFLGYAGHFDDSIIELVRRHPDVSSHISSLSRGILPFPGASSAFVTVSEIHRAGALLINGRR